MRSSRIAKTKTAAKAAAANPPLPPAHLSKKMKIFWRDTLSRNNLQPFQILILAKACESFDRAEQARRVFKKGGAHIFGSIRKAEASAGSGDRTQRQGAVRQAFKADRSL
jgi:hypothetical protein